MFRKKKQKKKTASEIFHLDPYLQLLHAVFYQTFQRFNCYILTFTPIGLIFLEWGMITLKMSVFVN